MNGEGNRENLARALRRWFKQNHAFDLLDHQTYDLVEYMDLGAIGTTLGELEEAQKAVVQIAQLISSRILYASSHAGIVPIPQFDIFAALDKPFVPTPAINDLHRHWHQHMKERARWTHELIQLIP